MNAALYLACAAVTLACMASVTASAQTPGDTADLSTPASDEPLVINGCPIWPYTRCPGADLRHANLVGKNLSGADLRGANLTRTDLRAANLATRLG